MSTEEDIARAINLMESINLKDFPLAPEALRFIKRHTKDPARKKQIDDILATEYYDSVERIVELALTAKSWQEIHDQLKPPAKRER